MVQLIALAAMAAFQAAANFQQADMIRQNAAFKKRVDDLNSESAALDAFNAEKEGYTESARYQQVVDRAVGADRSALASKGVDVNYGSAAELQDQNRLTGYLNQIDIERRAHEKAKGFTREADQLRMQGSMSLRQSNINAAATEGQGITSGLTTLVSGYARS